MYSLELAGEDDPFAAREAEAAAVSVEVAAPGLATAKSLEADRLRTLAYTRAASALLARCGGTVDDARLALEAADLARPHGETTGPAPGDSVAVRARDVRGLAGVSTSRAERELGSVLVDRGFEVDLDDPDHELRACFSHTAPETGDGEAVCHLGWLVAESVRDFGERKPTDRPFFQPGSMAPLDARALANIAGAGPGRTLLDPMCGTGGVLVEAGLVGSRVLGTDAQAKMARGAWRNLDHFLDGAFDVCRADATALPLETGTVNAVVFDAPYGRQSKIARHGLADLVAGALGEVHRVSTDEATCVLMADRSWREAAVEAGWRVDARFERRVHRSLVRHVHVLEK